MVYTVRGLLTERLPLGSWLNLIGCLYAAAHGSLYVLLLLWSLHDAYCICVTGCLPCRCLDTASIVLADMQLTNINTEELIRETLGSDTCDARRSVSDPAGGGKPDTGPCAFDRGLKSKYPAYDFPGREV